MHGRSILYRGSIGKVAGIMLATFSMVSVALAQHATVRWASETGKPQQSYVEVSGAGVETLKEAATFRSAGDWQRLLAIFTPALPGELPVLPMAGTYRIEKEIIFFQPLFPLERGMPYHAVFSPKSGGSIVESLTLPAAPAAPPTAIQTIYPTADRLPQNLLKFYIEFSAPMSRGNVYDYIHLLDQDGKEIELPFLQLGEELWDPQLTRLTLLFDPGRIKRGVEPLEDIGPALIAGKRFSLVIDPTWKDGTGQPLREGYRKDFSVVPPDRTTPEPKNWKVAVPSAETHGLLGIDFGEPMDHALSLRMIGVADSDGKPVPGSAALDQNERRWNLTPTLPWKAGTYQIVVRTTIEDLAGNNIGKPFDVDVFKDVQKQLESESVSIPFQVR